MAGRRTHTLPRFLQNGFASSRKGGEVYVWMYRKGIPGIEVNTTKVGVEKDFYGKPDESDLDDRITKLETEFSQLVDELRTRPLNGEPIDDERIPRFLAHIAIRQRYVPETIQDAMATVSAQLGSHLRQEENAIEMLAQELSQSPERQEYFKMFWRASGLTEDQIALKLRSPDEHWKEIAAEIYPLMKSGLEEGLDRMASTFENPPDGAFKAGYVESLSRNLHAEERVEHYGRYRWYVLSSSTPLLLGDCGCVFETAGKRRFRPIDEMEEGFVAAYLPIASTRLLVGSTSKHEPMIDVKLVNRAVARCSHKFFVSSTQLPTDSHLVKSLGAWAGVMNERELVEVMNDLKSKIKEH
ncbi:MAG: DUF4238 domain-containing protein [Acidobacteriota bacterium]